MYYGKPHAHMEAKKPRRAYERKNDSYLFSISYLDPDRTLPVLTLQQALLSTPCLDQGEPRPKHQSRTLFTFNEQDSAA